MYSDGELGRGEGLAIHRFSPIKKDTIIVSENL
jgi:hypothetical protein